MGQQKGFKPLWPGVNRKHMQFIHSIVPIAHPEPKFNSDGWVFVNTFTALRFLNRFQIRLAKRAAPKANHRIRPAGLLLHPDTKTPAAQAARKSVSPYALVWNGRGLGRPRTPHPTKSLSSPYPRGLSAPLGAE